MKELWLWIRHFFVPTAPLAHTAKRLKVVRLYYFKDRREAIVAFEYTPVWPLKPKKILCEMFARVWGDGEVREFRFYKYIDDYPVLGYTNLRTLEGEVFDKFNMGKKGVRII